jgi:hypothetical protein
MTVLLDVGGVKPSLMSRPISVPTAWAALCAEDDLPTNSYAGPPLGVEQRGGGGRLSTRKDCPGGPLTRLLRYICFLSFHLCGVFSLRHSRASVSTFPVIGPIDTTVLVVNLTTALRLVPSVLRVARPQQPCDCARRVGR